MSRGGPGVPGASRGGPQVFPKKTSKNTKTTKTLRSCMARLLRSNIQDFVQEVAQMAQGTPFRSCRIELCMCIYVCIYICM